MNLGPPAVLESKDVLRAVRETRPMDRATTLEEPPLASDGIICASKSVPLVIDYNLLNKIGIYGPILLKIKEPLTVSMMENGIFPPSQCPSLQNSY